MATSTLFTDVHAMSPSSVCIFSACAAPGIEGAERYANGIAAGIAQLGHKVTLVVSGTTEQFAEAERAGVHVTSLPCPFLPGAIRVSSRHERRDGLAAPRRAAARQAALQDLEGQRFNYVVVNGRFGPIAHKGLRFARERDIAPVVIEHNSIRPDSEPLCAAHAIEAVERVRLRHLERYRPHFFGVSKKANMLLERCGVQPSGVLPSAIDADAFVAQASRRDFRSELGIPKSALLVAAPEPLIAAKNPLALAEPVNALANEGADIYAVFAGEGALRKKLAQLEGKRIRVMGSLSQPDLAALLLQADICFLPTHIEAFSVSLLQAAACGTAVAVTEVGGADELILGRRYGRILANTEERAVTRALLHASNERELMAAQGRLLARQVRDVCTWDRTAAATLLACRRAKEKQMAATANNPMRSSNTARCTSTRAPSLSPGAML